MPSSPASPLAMTSAASPWKMLASALTMSQRMVAMIACSGSLLLGSVHRFALLDGVFDAADHVERLLGQVVDFAVDDHLERADGFLQRHVLAGRAGEHLGHVEWLREEALALARAVHGLLALFGKLVHAEDRDDVLQFLVALQRALHLARDVVVLLADHQRIELARGRGQRIDRGVDAERRDVT